MLIKLTYYGSGNPTLVNTENIETIYQLFDKTQGRYSTKITFGNNSYLNVEESLTEIMKIQENFYKGIYQDTECALPSATIQERFEESYQQPQRRQYRPRKNYEQQY
jgi:uncharacterized protein YlzI (FlbEa/FlbD family)